MTEWEKNTLATVGRHSDLQNPMWLHDSIHTMYRKMKVIDLERLLHSKKSMCSLRERLSQKTAQLEMKTSIKRDT